MSPGRGDAFDEFVGIFYTSFTYCLLTKLYDFCAGAGARVENVAAKSETRGLSPLSRKRNSIEQRLFSEISKTRLLSHSTVTPNPQFHPLQHHADGLVQPYQRNYTIVPR